MDKRNLFEKYFYLIRIRSHKTVCKSFVFRVFNWSSIFLQIIIFIIIPGDLFTSALSLSDSKSPQVFSTLPSILAVLNNAVVWMVSTCHLISKSCCPFINLLVIIPRAPITIGINITFMFYSFLNSLARPSYLSFFSLSFNVTLWSAGTAKFTILQDLFLGGIIIRSNRLTKIRWSVWMSKYQTSLWVPFSGPDVWLCIYHLFL